MSLSTRWRACWRGWRGWGRRGGHHRVSYLQPHTDGEVICVFVFDLCLSLSLSLSVSLPMLSQTVSATASYRCKDATKQLRSYVVQIFFVPSSISYSDNSCPQCGANTTKTFLGWKSKKPKECVEFWKLNVRIRKGFGAYNCFYNC